jgi:hypothetical protein
MTFSFAILSFPSSFSFQPTNLRRRGRIPILFFSSSVTLYFLLKKRTLSLLEPSSKSVRVVKLRTPVEIAEILLFTKYSSLIEGSDNSLGMWRRWLKERSRFLSKIRLFYYKERKGGEGIRHMWEIEIFSRSELVVIQVQMCQGGQG